MKTIGVQIWDWHYGAIAGAFCLEQNLLLTQPGTIEKLASCCGFSMFFNHNLIFRS